MDSPSSSSRRSERQSQAAYYRKLLRDEIIKRSFWLALIGLGSVVVLVWNKRRSIGAYSVVVSLLAVAAVSTWIAVEVWRRRSYRCAHHERQSFPYILRSKEISYVIGPDDQLHFKRTITIEAKVDGIDRYLDKYVWTAGQTPIPSAGAGVLETRRLSRVGIWTFYDTILERPLRKGDVYTFEVEWPPIENWKSSSPFVSASAEEPTKEMTFMVEIPDRYRASRRVLLEECRAIEAHNVYNATDYSFDNDRVEVKIPAKLFRHYRLRWSWANEPPVEIAPMVLLEHNQTEFQQ